jgi:hypothetical protein
MEGILTDIMVSSGVLLSILALLAIVVGGILLGRLAEEEKKGKEFHWAEWPLPESESDIPAEGLARRAA